MVKDPTELDEIEWLRHRIKQLRRLGEMTVDDLARQAIRELIEEAERRIATIKGLPESC
jgi:hypothetical protein